jgi:hypothetical protein
MLPYRSEGCWGKNCLGVSCLCLIRFPKYTVTIDTLFYEYVIMSFVYNIATCSLTPLLKKEHDIAIETWNA